MNRISASLIALRLGAALTSSSQQSDDELEEEEREIAKEQKEDEECELCQSPRKDAEEAEGGRSNQVASATAASIALTLKGDALNSPPSPSPFFIFESFAHQVAGHGSSNDAANSRPFLRHRRRRSAAEHNPTNCDHGCQARRRITDHSENEETKVKTDTLAYASDSEKEDIEDMVLHESTVLKPLPSKPKGRREEEFYSKLETLRRSIATFTGDDENEEVRHKRHWLTFFPRCYGVYTRARDQLSPSAWGDHSSHPTMHDSAITDAIPNNSTASCTSHLAPYRYLHLEDLTRSFAHPSLIDVKIGAVSYDPFECAHDSKKALEEIAKCPSQRQNGFRICGARIWDQHGETYEIFDKHWGRSFGPTSPTPPPSPSSSPECDESWWRLFGYKPPKRLNCDPRLRRPTDDNLRTASTILPIFIRRLEELSTLCHTYPLWRLYASSMLFAYEIHPQPRATLHLIDFGHAYRINEIPPPANHPNDANHKDAHQSSSIMHKYGVDENYLIGLNNLLSIFNRMYEYASDRIGPAVSLSSPLSSTFSTSSTHFHSHYPRLPSGRLKLSHSIRSKWIGRKTILATIRSLVENGRIAQSKCELLTELLYCPPPASSRLFTLLKSSCHSHRSLISSLKPTIVRAISAHLSEGSQSDGCNTSFVTPAYTIALSNSSRHPRSRRWHRELQSAREVEEEQNKQIQRGLTLKSFTPSYQP